MSQEIFVPIDVSQESAAELAIPFAVEIAQCRGTTIRLVTAIPDVDTGMYLYTPIYTSHAPVQTTDKAREAMAERLKEIGDKNVPSGVNWHSDVIVGRVPHVLIQEINNARPGMVVMAAHNPGWADYLMGSVSDQVVRHVRSPVLVVRDQDTGS